jgi:tetratricopeptide (TPR) repeat protein
MGATRDPAQSDCVGCHMVKARPRDVIETVITDHLIRRAPPSTDLTAQRAQPTAPPRAPLAPIPYLAERTAATPLLEAQRGLAARQRIAPGQLQAWRESLAAASGLPPSAHVSLARAYAAVQDFRTAVEILSQTNQQHPKDAVVLWNLGLALHRIGQNERALPQVVESLTIRADAHVYALLGNLHSVLGQKQEARKAYETSLGMRPNQSPTWAPYAALLTALGETDAAIEAYAQLIALNPDLTDAFLRIGDLHRLAGRPREMLRVLRQGATRSIDLELELVVAHLLGTPPVRDHAKAVALARGATARHPLHPRAWLHLALATTYTGQDDAATALDRARALGADPACCEGIAVMHSLRLQDLDGANRDFERYRVLRQTTSHERLRTPVDGILQHLLARQRRQKR